MEISTERSPVHKSGFVCTKRGGVGFFRRVSKVMHLAVKFIENSLLFYKGS